MVGDCDDAATFKEGSEYQAARPCYLSVGEEGEEEEAFEQAPRTHTQSVVKWHYLRI